MKERKSWLSKKIFLQMTVSEVILVVVGGCVLVAAYRGYHIPIGGW